MIPGTVAADPAASFLAAATELVEDLDLEWVKEWKKAHPGCLAIGSLPIYVPRPLFEAIGCLPVGVYGGGDQVDILRGDAYFQSYICHIPRSVLEMALAGRLDALDGMIFPSICDVIRNLGGMWKLLFPDRYAAYLDLPQNFDPEVGGRFYLSELRRIARELEELGALPLTAERLAKAIEEENNRRQALHELALLRRERPWSLKASEAYLMVRSGTLIEAAEHERRLRGFLSAVERRNNVPRDNVRAVLVGSFCEQPPMGLLRTLERSGCDIVADDLQLGLYMVGGRIEIEEDPLHALAHSYLKQGVDTASRYLNRGEKGRALLDLVRDCRADGVIFAAASFCDPALLDQPMLETALEREGVPFTSFKFSENTGQYHNVREQAGAFSDAVKLWGSVQ